MECAHLLLENQLPACLSCSAVPSIGSETPQPVTEFFPYRMRNENPSNTYSCFPSLEIGLTSPRRTCCMAVTTFGKMEGSATGTLCAGSNRVSRGAMAANFCIDTTYASRSVSGRYK